MRIDEVGVPTYDELVLVANEASLERDGDRIRAFIAALSRGTEDMKEKPEAAADGLLEANPDLDAELQRAVVKVTLPLFLPERGRPFGYQEPRGVAGVRRMDAREPPDQEDPRRVGRLHQRSTPGGPAINRRYDPHAPSHSPGPRREPRARADRRRMRG